MPCDHRLNAPLSPHIDCEGQKWPLPGRALPGLPLQPVFNHPKIRILCPTDMSACGKFAPVPYTVSLDDVPSSGGELFEVRASEPQQGRQIYLFIRFPLFLTQSVLQ